MGTRQRQAKEDAGLTQNGATTAGTSSGPGWAAHREPAATGLMAVACFFLVGGAGLMSVALIKLAVPVLFDEQAFLSYGRLRAAAMLTLVYGFGAVLTKAVAYYLTPRLVGTTMPGQKIALMGGLAYAGLVAVGAATVLLRGPSGPEMSEIPPLIAWPMALLLLIPAGVVTMMIRNRTEEATFVSLLYIMGGVWWFPALHIIGTLPGLEGIGPFLQTSLVTGGLLWVAMPAAALGGAYYTLVKESDRPLYSGQLAKAGFWTLAGTGLVATPIRFLGGPAPDWTETVAVTASLGLIVSGLALMANFVQTLAGHWEAARESLEVRYLMAGASAYTVVMVIIGVTGFRSVSAMVGLTTWHEGLAIALTLVAVPILGLAFLLHAFPRITGRGLVGEVWAERGRRLVLWGGGMCGGIMALAGLISGMTWNWASASGARTNFGSGFAVGASDLHVLYTLAALAALVALGGIGLAAWSVLASYISGTSHPVEVLMPVVTSVPEEVGEDE